MSLTLCSEVWSSVTRCLISDGYCFCACKRDKTKQSISGGSSPHIFRLCNILLSIHSHKLYIMDTKRSIKICEDSDCRCFGHPFYSRTKDCGLCETPFNPTPDLSQRRNGYLPQNWLQVCNNPACPSYRFFHLAANPDCVHCTWAYTNIELPILDSREDLPPMHGSINVCLNVACQSYALLRLTHLRDCPSCAWSYDNVSSPITTERTNFERVQGSITICDNLSCSSYGKLRIVARPDCHHCHHKYSHIQSPFLHGHTGLKDLHSTVIACYNRDCISCGAARDLKHNFCIECGWQHRERLVLDVFTGTLVPTMRDPLPQAIQGQQQGDRDYYYGTQIGYPIPPPPPRAEPRTIIRSTEEFDMATAPARLRRLVRQNVSGDFVWSRSSGLWTQSDESSQSEHDDNDKPNTSSAVASSGDRPESDSNIIVTSPRSQPAQHIVVDLRPRRYVELSEDERDADTEST